MSDISIIIVNWNTKDYLRKCISSILHYSDRSSLQIEIIIVDNDSDDGSPEMIINEFPEVTLIQLDNNVGFARGNNTGIEKSTGRYLCFVNSDVEFIEDSISRMYDYMEKNESIGVLGPQLLNADKTLQPSYTGALSLWRYFCRALFIDRAFPQLKLFSGYEMTYFKGDRIQDVDILIGAFWMIRKEAIDVVGVLDDRYFMYSEDRDWCYRFRKNGWRVVYFPGTKVIHYGGGSSKRAPIKYYAELQKSIHQYWKTHKTTPSLMMFSALMMLYNILRLSGWFALFIIKPSRRDECSYQMKKYARGLSALISCILKK